MAINEIEIRRILTNLFANVAPPPERFLEMMLSVLLAKACLSNTQIYSMFKMLICALHKEEARHKITCRTKLMYRSSNFRIYLHRQCFAQPNRFIAFTIFQHGFQCKLLRSKDHHGFFNWKPVSKEFTFTLNNHYLRLMKLLQIFG